MVQQHPGGDPRYDQNDQNDRYDRYDRRVLRRARSVHQTGILVEETLEPPRFRAFPAQRRSQLDL